MYDDKSREELINILEYFKNQYMLLSLDFEKKCKEYRKLLSMYNKLYFEYKDFKENEKRSQLCLL